MMLKFDTIIVAPNANPDSPCAQGVPCPTPEEGIDNANCSDPIYAATHPGICLSAPRLIVKPDYAIREVGKTVQYKAMLWSGGTETDVTDDVEWTTSSVFTAVIGQTGHATALGVGIVTVSATYGLLYGYAQLEVIAEGGCSVLGNAYVLTIDNSESAGIPFSGLYPSRLAFAKDQAQRFLNNVDFSKDTAVVVSFNTSGTVVAEETSDLATALAAVSAIPQTMLQTNVQAGLQTAYEATATGKRVIILFTDGEQKEGGDPVAYAESIRNGSNFIIVVGLRANGTAFNRLNRIANGGFFLNAIVSNQESIQNWLSGLQSYLCSGSCGPAGDVVVGVGAINYTGFAKWEVTDGVVDLIGKNTGGPELFDLLPGNALYVDLCGTSGLGTMRSNAGEFTLVAGNHTINITLAGNQREDRTPDVVKVSLYSGIDQLIYSDEIEITDHLMPFTEYSIPLVVDGGDAGPDAYIVVEQLSIPGGGWDAAGVLFKEIELLNAADEVIFESSFGEENQQFITPNCGPATLEGFTQYSGYCYGYGCLDAPIPAQVPDPNPLTDVEAVE